MRRVRAHGIVCPSAGGRRSEHLGRKRVRLAVWGLFSQGAQVFGVSTLGGIAIWSIYTRDNAKVLTPFSFRARGSEWFGLSTLGGGGRLYERPRRERPHPPRLRREAVP